VAGLRRGGAARRHRLAVQPDGWLHVPPPKMRSLRRGGGQNRWHALVNCDHGDSTTSRYDPQMGGSMHVPPPNMRRVASGAWVVVGVAHTIYSPNTLQHRKITRSHARALPTVSAISAALDPVRDPLLTLRVIEAPWLVKGGHGASLKHHKVLARGAMLANHRRMPLSRA
jgi:hypothetical protein